MALTLMASRSLRWILPLAGLVLTGCAVVPAEPAYPGPVVYGGTVAPAPVMVAPGGAPVVVAPAPVYYAPPPVFWSPPPPVYVRPPLWYGGGPPYVARPQGHYRPQGAPRGANPRGGNGSIGSAIRGVQNQRP